MFYTNCIWVKRSVFPEGTVVKNEAFLVCIEVGQWKRNEYIVLHW